MLVSQNERVSPSLCKRVCELRTRASAGITYACVWTHMWVYVRVALLVKGARGREEVPAECVL